MESEFYSDYGAEGYNKELKQLLIDQENTDKMLGCFLWSLQVSLIFNES